MRFGLIILACAVIFLGLKVNFLHTENEILKQTVEFYSQQYERLQKEQLRIKTLYAESKNFQQEIVRGLKELEEKIDLEKLKRRISKDVWAQIEPIITRIRQLKDNPDLETSSLDSLGR